MIDGTWLRDPTDENLKSFVKLKYVYSDDIGLHHWWAASVKWDGCIHFHRAYNEPFEKFAQQENDNAMQDYIHICDLDEYIEILIKLRDAAKRYFATHDRNFPDL